MKDPRWWRRPRYIPCGVEPAGHEPDEESLELMASYYREILSNPDEYAALVPNPEETMTRIKHSLHALENRDWKQLHKLEFFGCPIN